MRSNRPTNRSPAKANTRSVTVLTALPVQADRTGAIAADAERGQIVKAYVVLRPGQPADDTMVRTLQDFVKANIAPYKYPRIIEFRSSLPRTETGKLQRFRLRAG